MKYFSAVERLFLETPQQDNDPKYTAIGKKII